MLDAQLRRGSEFARQHGFYVDVVTPEIASLPTGWQRRLKPMVLGSITVHCVDLYDLLVSKLADGRLKNLEFVAAMLQLGLANARLVRQRIRRFSLARDRQRTRLRLGMVLDELR